MPNRSSKISAKVVAKSAPNRRRAAAHAVLECGMAETVIGGALVRVLEDLVGLVDFLEAMLGVLIAGIAVRMTLHRQLAEGGFDVGIARGALDRRRLS